MNARGFHCSVINKNRVSNKRRGLKWVCFTHCMHVELICKICVEKSADRRVINLIVKRMFLDVRHTIVFWSVMQMEENNPTALHYVFWERKKGHRCRGRRFPTRSTQRLHRYASISDRRMSTVPRRASKHVISIGGGTRGAGGGHLPPQRLKTST